jgi:hypothetical protein
MELAKPIFESQRARVIAFWSSFQVMALWIRLCGTEYCELKVPSCFDDAKDPNKRIDMVTHFRK